MFGTAASNLPWHLRSTQLESIARVLSQYAEECVFNQCAHVPASVRNCCVAGFKSSWSLSRTYSCTALKPCEGAVTRKGSTTNDRSLLLCILACWTWLFFLRLWSDVVMVVTYWLHVCNETMTVIVSWLLQMNILRLAFNDQRSHRSSVKCWNCLVPECCYVIAIASVWHFVLLTIGQRYNCFLCP